MSLQLMIVLIGLLYILIFGGISLLRREGLSIRFAVESIVITAIVYVLAVLTSIQIHPVIFLAILYLVTMRIRLLVDLANSFAKRGQSDWAEKIYAFASRLWPDTTNDLIIKLNHAIHLLMTNHLDESIALFTEVLSEANRGYLGMKYEAAAHFNLGVAYQRKNNPSMATIEFNEAIDTFPGSLYARVAQAALDHQHKAAAFSDNKPTDN